MNRQASPKQSGFAVLAIAVVVVLLLAATAGYVVLLNQTGEANPFTALRQASNKAEDSHDCGYQDDTICMFLSAQQQQSSYTMTISGQQDGQESTTTVKMDSHGTTSVQVGSVQNAFSIIQSGDTTYTKYDDSGWWKRVNSTGSADDNSYEFKVPSATASAEERVNFQRLDKEACGQHTCFKYSFTGKDDNGSVQYIWFDDHDYLLRKVQITSSSGPKTDITYDYGEVHISIPSHAQDMPDMPNMPMQIPDMSLTMPNLNFTIN